MSKGSSRRKEDYAKVNENLGKIKWGVNDALKTDSKDKDRHLEEAGDIGEEMRLMQEKMGATDLPWFFKEQAQ